MVNVEERYKRQAGAYTMKFSDLKKCKHPDSQLDLSFFTNGIIWRLCSLCGKRWRVKFTDNDSVIINEFYDF